MTKLEKLIQELCPDGVEYKELQEILTIKNGSDYKHLSKGDIPVYGSGGIMTYVETFSYDKPSVLIPRKGSIDKLYYVEAPFWNVDTIFYTDIDSTQIKPKYLFYCLQREHLEQYNTAGGVPSLTQAVLNKVQIPVPPLPVQCEIVRILDNFTELTSELNEHLSRELTARKQQYAYYRDKLLEQHMSANMCLLGTVCEVYDGTHQTPQYVESGVPFVSVEDIDNIYATQKFVTQEAYEKFKMKPQIGDVFMTRITAGVIGKCAIVTRNDNLAYYVSLALLRPNQKVLRSRYLKHYLESGIGKTELAKRILWNATPTKINKDDIGKIFISIPPVKIQDKLVEVLDNFTTLCTDLSSGLPAEIEARQKQYEYYRDKLLEFEK